jgi:hypothetical protein
MQQPLKICFAVIAAGTCNVSFAANLHGLRETGSPNPTALTVDAQESRLSPDAEMGKSLCISYFRSFPRVPLRKRSCHLMQSEMFRHWLIDSYPTIIC